MTRQALGTFRPHAASAPKLAANEGGRAAASPCAVARSLTPRLLSRRAAPSTECRCVRPRWGRTSRGRASRCRRPSPTAVTAPRAVHTWRAPCELWRRCCCCCSPPPPPPPLRRCSERRAPRAPRASPLGRARATSYTPSRRAPRPAGPPAGGRPIPRPSTPQRLSGRAQRAHATHHDTQNPPPSLAPTPQACDDEAVCTWCACLPFRPVTHPTHRADAAAPHTLLRHRRCASAAVPAACYDIKDAARLPPSIFKCDKH